MKKYRDLVVIIYCFAASAGVSAATTGGTIVKTWVSTTGHDTGTCPITSPCQTFQYAIDQTAAGGEVDVKDSGGFGAMVITKAISIIAADGVLALISVPSGGTGITINAGSSDVVIISGLTLDGHLLGGTGIISKSQCYINRSTFRNLQYGLHISKSVSTVSQSLFYGNVNGITEDYDTSLAIDGNRFFYNHTAVDAPYTNSAYTLGNNSFSTNYNDLIGNLNSISPR
jgi:hypothetical protein